MKKLITFGLGIGVGAVLFIGGQVFAATCTGSYFGGTGVCYPTVPSYGQVLVGTAAGGYVLTATSSLGITGSGGSGVWPFTTSDTNYNIAVQSTTTPEWFRGSPYSLFASTTAVLTYASTTAFSASNLTSGNCVQASTGGMLTTTGSACGSGGGAFSFTPTASYNATGTAIGFLGGAFTNGSTTVTSVGSGLLGANNGLLYGFASSSLFGFTPLPFPTSTNPLMATYFVATSSTATSSLSGDVLIGANDSTPYLRVGSTTPNYGYFNNDLIDVYDKRNDELGINIGNSAVGTCASSNFVMNGDISGAATDFFQIGFANSGWTGSSCALNSKTGVNPEDGFMYNPTGNLDLLTGSTTAPVGIRFFTGGTAAGNERIRLNSIGYLGLGTTTPNGSMFTIASSTGPQLSLSDGLGSSLWTMRNINGNLYLATSTYTATTTTSAFTLFGTGAASLSIGSTTPTLSAVTGLLTLGSNSAGSINASSTISAGKFQIDLYTPSGHRNCVFMSDTGWATSTGACNP